MNSIQQRQVPATITHLRAEIEALPRDSGGKRQGISEELKKRIVGALRTSQMPMKEFSSAVAVSISAVTTWKQRLDSQKAIGRRKASDLGSGFKKMSVVTDPESLLPSAGWTIEGPNGLRVTGLSAEDLARLWRALC